MSQEQQVDSRGSPLRVLTAAVALLSLVLWLLVAGLGIDPAAPLAVHRQAALVALLGVTFLLTEAVQLHVEMRRQSLLISLSEIPLVVGLFLVSPTALLLTRATALLLVAGWRRSPPGKVAFNTVTVTAEVAVVVLVFAGLSSRVPASSSGPSSWAAAYAAVLLGTVLSSALVAAALVRLKNRLGVRDLWSLSGPVLVSAVLNTTVALVALMLLEADLRSGLLLAVLLGGSALVYRAYGELLRRHRSLAQLQSLTDGWSQGEGVREVSRSLLVLGRPLLRAGHVELDVQADATRYRATLADDDTTPREEPSELGAALLADVRRNGTTVFRRRDRRAAGRATSGGVGLRDAIAVPLRHGGETFGALLVANRLGDTSTFDREDVELVELIASQAAVALHNGRLIDRLRHDATHDALTGLPNRAAFQDGMAAALAGGGTFSVLLMDLDGFKDVNDTLGHHQGDELLRAVAQRLQASLSPPVLFARLGGDEFAVLVPQQPGRPDGVAVAQQLHETLAAPFLVDGVQLDVRCSVGVSLSPEDGRDGPTLLKRADIAMYEAKTAGKRVQAYDASADRSSHRRLALVAELRGAIDRDELVCHYQPQLDLRTGEVTGAEALVRWPHPDLGMVLPDDFIPVAEQTGLVVPLTMSVLRTALRQSAAWQARGRPLGVAVNVSPRGLLAVGFAQAVQRVLVETGTPPERLTLEITESSVMADPGQAVRVLRELHDAGVRLSVDDFGTGYSSLAYLQRLPVDEVKIDKSFVRDLGLGGDDAAIVRAIVDMGHILGLQVVAEGVEDTSAARLLLDLGCDLVQGYLYSPALSAPAFWAWCGQHGDPVESLPVPRSG